MGILVCDGGLPHGLYLPRQGLTGNASGEGEVIAVTRRQVPLRW
jgi:hypothetical protein